MSSSAARVAPSYAPRYNSSTSRPMRGAPSSIQQTSRPQIQVIKTEDTFKARRAWPILLIGLLVIVLAFALPLVVNTRMAQTSYAIRDVRVELAGVKAESTVLESQLHELNAAPSLQSRAQELGLVRAAAPGVISLTDGTVNGGEPAE